MLKFYTAVTPVFNSTTGVLYQAGDQVPVEGNEEMFVPDANGKVPGFDPAEQVATQTYIAGQDNVQKGAGQDGQAPAKKPAAETIEQLEAAVDVEEGGPSRTKDEPAAPSALD